MFNWNERVTMIEMSGAGDLHDQILLPPFSDADSSRFRRLPARSQYDLLVIGSGPAGQRAAVQAAKLGKSALVIERQRMGGACLHLGTIPSKALREVALHSSRANSLQIVMQGTRRVIEDELAVIEEQLVRNQIEFVSGTGSFVDPTHVSVRNELGECTVKGSVILIAAGTRPRRPDDLDFDGVTLFDSDTILAMEQKPRNLLVLGAGVIGCEYASIFARTGVKVTLADSKPDLLRSIDPEIVSSLLSHFGHAGIEVRLRTRFENLHGIKGANGQAVASVDLITETDQGEKRVRCLFDAVLYCLGRIGNHELLNLRAIGLVPDDRGHLTVNRNYQTRIPHVYAVGDIIGAPALAASSSEQGRLAALHAFTGQQVEFPDTFPYGIYTIPEISSVGVQESELTAREIKYVVGKASYTKLARGKMIGDEHGFLKLLVHARTRRVMGIHVIGTSATELVHIGQVAMSFGATVEFFIENVFNYPTLAEAYKVAAYNAFNKLKKP